jgi:hypothetical protein
MALSHRARRAAALVATLVIAAPAFAARPLVTDDARIVDPRSCQLESFYKHNADGHEAWALPGCNPFGNLELTIGGNRMTGPEPESHLIVQGKTVIRVVEPNNWGLALAAGAVDTTSPGNTRRFGTLYAYAPLTFSVADDRFLFHLNAGVERDRSASETRFTWGVANETVLTSRIALVAETFGNDRENPFWQAGARVWIVPGRVQIDATRGGQFRAGGDGLWWSIGLRLLSPPLW